MRNYKDLFFWENQRRIEELEIFLGDISVYVQNYQKNNQTELVAIRNRIMLKSNKIEEIFLQANVIPIMSYGSMASGHVAHNITSEIPFFVKEQFGILGSDDDTLLKIQDMYLRTMGLYKDNRKRSIFNIVNPFLYIKIVTDIFLVPLFKLFNVPESKQNVGIWNLIKSIKNIIAYIATIWILFQAFGADVKIISFIKNIHIK
jgi:hypothetical protein